MQQKAAKVIACVNHDKNAIASHMENHPQCVHFTEDIRTLELMPLVTLARHARQLNPDVAMLFIDLFCGAGGVTSGIEHAKIFANLTVERMFDRPLMALWASLECTNFSKAKGGLARDADSRTLAEHLFRYLEAIDFDCIFIENVEEFMSWGPLDENGRPISKDKGTDYTKWIEQMKAYGYEYDYRILNAADFGSHTSRKRFFGIFSRPHIPINWPIQTHSKKLTPGLVPWKPVKNVLDLHLLGENIFLRKKNLAEATLERIWEGLNKHINENNGMFLDYYYGNGYSSSINKPSGTLTTKDRINVVHFLLFPQWGPKCSHSINKPSPVLPARMDKMCPYIINAETGFPTIQINDDDTPFTKKIKYFMNEHHVAEVRMRGLNIPEMLRITGLGSDYKLIGTLQEQKKYIGNAVPVELAQAIIEGFIKPLIEPMTQVAVA